MAVQWLKLQQRLARAHTVGKGGGCWASTERRRAPTPAQATSCRRTPADGAGAVGGGDGVVAAAAQASVAARLQRHRAGGVQAHHAAAL